MNMNKLNKKRYKDQKIWFLVNLFIISGTSNLTIS